MKLPFRLFTISIVLYFPKKNDSYLCIFSSIVMGYNHLTIKQIWKESIVLCNLFTKKTVLVFRSEDKRRFNDVLLYLRSLHRCHQHTSASAIDIDQTFPAGR